MSIEETKYVLIDSLCTHTKIGCTKEERAFEQRLEFDLEIKVQSCKTAQRGELDDTVCYAKVSELVLNLSQNSEWILVEDLAKSCIEQIFEEFPLAQRVAITIRKQIVPNTNWTGIRIERQKTKSQKEH